MFSRSNATCCANPARSISSPRFAWNSDRHAPTAAATEAAAMHAVIASRSLFDQRVRFQSARCLRRRATDEFLCDASDGLLFVGQATSSPQR